MIAKRIFDLFFSLVGVLFLAPLFIFVSVWIKLDSPGPVFFRQERVGRYGKAFRIFKFRSMCLNAESKGGLITVGEDPRITRSGGFLRRHKLDELPQLLNVIWGEMSLVGPRPEVPRYVAMYPSEVCDLVLSVQPGITDYASIEYKDENAILGRAVDPDRTYVEEVMPVKLSYYQRYVAERSLWIDFVLILRTLKAIVK
jgi:lipopolysaccharide/colanic/teichoic acid biosynthesis glycosyltransferase